MQILDKPGTKLSKIIYLDKDGTIRNRTTLEKIGNWFRVAETIYWIPLKHIKL